MRIPRSLEYAMRRHRSRAERCMETRADGCGAAARSRAVQLAIPAPDGSAEGDRRRHRVRPGARRLPAPRPADFVSFSRRQSRALPCRLSLVGSAGVLAVSAHPWDDSLVLLAASAAAYRATSLVPEAQGQPPGLDATTAFQPHRRHRHLECVSRAQAAWPPGSRDGPRRRRSNRRLQLFDELSPRQPGR